MSIRNWIESLFPGHVGGSWPFVWTLYGFNAMHVALQVHTKRWGWVCFHPTTRTFGGHWPWYFYVSPNATPWAATWGIGARFTQEERQAMDYRRRCFGHNFNTRAVDYEAMQPPASGVTDD